MWPQRNPDNDSLIPAWLQQGFSSLPFSADQTMRSIFAPSDVHTQPQGHTNYTTSHHFKGPPPLNVYRHQAKSLSQQNSNLDDFDRSVLQGRNINKCVEFDNAHKGRISLGPPALNGDALPGPSTTSIGPLHSSAHYRQTVAQPHRYLELSTQIQPNNSRHLQSFSQDEPLRLHDSSGIDQQQQASPGSDLTRFVYRRADQIIHTSSPFEASSPTSRLAQKYASIPHRSISRTQQQQIQDSQGHLFTTSMKPMESNHLILTPPTLSLGHAPLMANGIQLISTHELPDRFRTVFSFPLFNAVQSKCFKSVYNSNDNVVVSAPTGSGKTAILEIAICRLVERYGSDQFKIVYQAPTKSLCAERVRDWHKKFSQLNLNCAELTGDTSSSEMARVGNASIIVTTPEKWDSITRKWKDYMKLLQMVKLFLIDEVHILGDARGATLEAVVSRMKSIGADVRFVALSATIPNSQDIATWLGKDHTNGHLPAHRETFGEEFRPVKLQKHVYGFESKANNFAFDAVLDRKITDLIRRHTHKKPIMVFCCTRKACEKTAAKLAQWWASQSTADRAWPSPIRNVAVQSIELRAVVTSGVAFHHAGLDVQDRTSIEMAFLKGHINVICCTSTLAVGINLPCHLVVIKGTSKYSNGYLEEYSDLDLMQMLGRAGRPQFDDSAVAIIMTRQSQADHYKKMVAGQDILESTLHLNFIEHLNSEIGLGTVHNIDTAKQWLAGTFLAVRMRQNPKYYDLGLSPRITDVDEKLEQVCARDIKLLQGANLVSDTQRYTCTEYGEAMSRYMIQFETMKLLLDLPEHAKMGQILQIICEASEFKDLRLKPKERAMFRELNKSPFIKFPIKVNIASSAHKVSLIIQVQLGGIDLPNDKEFNAIRTQYLSEKNLVFDRMKRLIRCVVDCKAYDCDAVATRSSLDLARSIHAGYWENMHLQLRQIPDIGPAGARKLVQADIRSIQQLSALQSSDIERILSRNPPFGKKIKDSTNDFPRFTLKATLTGNILRAGECIKTKIKAQMRLSNSKFPKFENRNPNVSFLATVSSGTLAHFWRGSLRKLEKEFEISFTAELTGPEDIITCYVACDEIVGTIKTVDLQPDILASAFPPPKPKYALKEIKKSQEIVSADSDEEYGMDEIEEKDLLAAVQTAEAPVDNHGQKPKLDDFFDIDDFDDDLLNDTVESPNEPAHPVKMENGKWACNHFCSQGSLLKSGKPCSHKCCRDGVDKPHRITKKKSMNKIACQQIAKSKPAEDLQLISHGFKKLTGKERDNAVKERKSPFDMSNNWFRMSDEPNNKFEDAEVIDLSHEPPEIRYEDIAPRDYRKLHNLHEKVQKANSIKIPNLTKSHTNRNNLKPDIPFLEIKDVSCLEQLENYGDSVSDDLPSPAALLRNDVSYTGENHGCTPPVRVASVIIDGSVVSKHTHSGSATGFSMMDSDASVNLDAETLESTTSFVDQVFDFDEYNSNHHGPSPSPSIGQGLKRLSTSSPSQKEIAKYRRVTRDKLITPHRVVSEEMVRKEDEVSAQGRHPVWVGELDEELIQFLGESVTYTV